MKYNGEDIGVRDAQRSLGLSSPSTIIWHLDKLADAGLVEKTPTNKYRLDQRGKEYNDLKIPVTHSLHFFRGFFFPGLVFVVSFLIFGLLSTSVLWLIDAGPTSLFLNSVLIIVITLFMILREWYKIQSQLGIYYQN